jgi:glycosyltransferase involved in cell wall biosynthesis/SAM-dependent methyltransferase
MTLHLAVAGPLPPARTGPADYVKRSLPALARLAEVTCLTGDPGAVDADLRQRFRVRSLEERHDPAFDLVVYHVANNPFHEDVVAAAMDGPPGLIVLHDGSLHHLMSDVHLKFDRHDEYRRLLGDAHGAAGEALARVRSDGARGDVDLFLYDLLRPLVDRHLGVIVHSRYAADLVETRAQGTRVWVVPHFAHLPPPAAPSAMPQLPTADVLVGHFGFITPPKRPVEILTAFARIRREGIDAHLVFCGTDQTRGLLASTIGRLGLRNHVTVTGYATEEAMAALMEAVDIVVSVRSPHVGETSGTLTTALAAGKAVIADSVGTWAELPDDVVERAGGGTEPELIDSLTRALRALARDPELRATRGRAASTFAATELDVDRCMRRLVDAAKEITSHPMAAPIRTLTARRAAVAEFLAGGIDRLDDAVAGTGTATSRIIARGELARYQASLTFVPAARPGQRLLDIGAFAPMMRVFETVWGYRVSGCNKPTGVDISAVELVPSGGLPAYTAEIEACDVEAGVLPYEVGTFDVITCWEVFEHLGRDPMALLCECNRILRPGGTLVLTTPNVVSSRSLRAVLGGGHPYLWSQFQTVGIADRHQREYTPNELRWLLTEAGFSDDGVITQDVWSPPDDDAAEVVSALGYNAADRGDNVVAVARKVGLPGDRYPAWLYHS